MKKPLTNKLLLVDQQGRKYALPKSVAKKYLISSNLNRINDSIEAKIFFKPFEDKYTKPGMLLKGLRLREGLSQKIFAEKIGITQSNLSNMELGRRPIGKKLAERIATKFDIDYRYLL